MSKGLLKQLKEQGFDKSESHGVHCLVRCSRCEAIVINGVPCHEHGCPNKAAREKENSYEAE